jgi:hypothetical protein
MTIATQTQSLPTTNKRTARCAQCHSKLNPGEGAVSTKWHGYGRQTTYLCANCNEIAQSITATYPIIKAICNNIPRDLCPLPSIEEAFISQYLRSKAGKHALAVIQAVAAKVTPGTNQYTIYAMIDRETVRANCPHTNTIYDLDGGFYLSFGEATDNITETAFCLDCGAHIVTDHDVAGLAAELWF